MDDPVAGGFPDEERMDLCARLSSEAGVCADWTGPGGLSTDALLCQSRLLGARAFVCKAASGSDKTGGKVEDMYKVRVVEADGSWWVDM